MSDTTDIDPTLAMLGATSDTELGARVRHLAVERRRAGLAYAASQRAQAEAEQARHDAYKAYLNADRALVEALHAIGQASAKTGDA